MSIRWTDENHSYNPVMMRWETDTAEFFQLEVSPSHIFRVKIDKGEEKKERGE
ncbi:MAG: hypothetical protein HQ572_05815 [Candidatus Omnitrophica bacterium]|nr:hypothetical protein [Candidatus Omnitrophota bacterium]